MQQRGVAISHFCVVVCIIVRTFSHMFNQDYATVIDDRGRAYYGYVRVLDSSTLKYNDGWEIDQYIEYRGCIYVIVSKDDTRKAININDIKRWNPERLI